MSEYWDRLFPLWMLATGFGGMALNYWLFNVFHRRATARNGVAAIVVGLLLQWGLTLPVILWIIQSYDVPEQYQESVGYFVSPFVLAFVSLPTALYVLYRPSFREHKSASTFSP